MAGTAQGDRATRDASGGPSGCRHNRRGRPVGRHPSRGAVPRSGGKPGQRARRGRDRTRRCGLRAFSRWRPDYHRERVSSSSSPSHHHAGSQASNARSLFPTHVCRRRRSNLVRSRCARPVPARGRLRRSHPQGREAGRPAGAGADQVRAGDQPQDRQGARPRHAGNRAGPRRRGDRMRRREFITLIGGAAVAWPFAARAQQSERVRRIGLLMAAADDSEGQARVTALKQGLQELGWTDGRNIQIETRFGAADAGRIRAHAAELVALAPEVIVAHTTPVIRALRQATSSIPIVIATVNDPVEQGFVSSLAHPGGNITGFMFIDFQMVGKWLEMLKEAAPSVTRAALMFSPDTSPHYYVYLRSFEAMPRSVAVEVTAAPVRDTAEVEEAIAKLGREPGCGLIVPGDAFTLVHYQLLIRLAQQHRVPAVYFNRTSVAQGGLMSYGPDPYDNFRRSASYVDRIFKGAKPADLPVQQPTKFELAINLKTAKALGLEIPPMLLARADEVIE